MRTRLRPIVARLWWRAILVTAIAVVAAQCSGQHALTSPSSVGAPKGAPIIRSITLDRQNVVAGQAVTASAEVDDPDATGGLRYEWSVAPASGTLDGNGATGQWRSPSNDRVPGSYTLTLTVIKPYIGTDASGHPANLEYRVNGSSAPITVNDAKREMEANSEAFIADVMNPNVTPDLCVRNFADSCDGKQKALQDIATSRAGYSGATASSDFRLFQLGNDPASCIAPDGSARCALIVYDVEWVLTRTTDGVQVPVKGTEYFTGTYDKNRWWLCSSRFAPQ